MTMKSLCAFKVNHVIHFKLQNLNLFRLVSLVVFLLFRCTNLVLLAVDTLGPQTEESRVLPSDKLTPNIVSKIKMR